MNSMEMIRIRQAEIKKLRQILAERQYLAAGITLALKIGVEEGPLDYDFKTEVGVYTDLEAMLSILLDGLIMSMQQSAQTLQKDVVEATKLLESLK